MKKKFQRIAMVSALSLLISVPCNTMTTQAAVINNEKATHVVQSVSKFFTDKKDDLKRRVASLIGVDVGDVKDVTVDTDDNVTVTLEDTNINIDIDFNLINININKK